jgi:hypothetical protein
MLCYPFNGSESWRGPGSFSKDLSNAILSIPAETIPFPKLSKNIRKEIRVRQIWKKELSMQYC